MSFALDVRRLAAIDMWGSAGARWRRWVILVEFLLGVFALAAIGLVTLRSGGAARTPMAVWLIGVATNYVPLSLHALTLIRPGALEAEIEGADVRAELRHYGVAQLWVAVPLLLVVLAIGQWRRRPAPLRGRGRGR
jgi:ABC-type Fe3+-siderophore transport system permease subunit